MNLIFIERYIDRLKKEDIYNYASKEGIIINNQELDTLYTYLKTYYKTFLRNKDTRLNLLSEIKAKVSTPVSKKLDELYYLYNDKI